MKQAIRSLALTSALFACAIAHADEAPFDVNMHVEQGVGVVQLQAVADQIVLTGYNINRGNCKTKLGGIYPLPLTFKYGQGVKLFAYTCKVKEVVLNTNQGNYTYTFN